jgi:hypothetical protein
MKSAGKPATLAAPRHPIRNPLRFRSMPPPPLVASRTRSQLLFGFFARMLLRVETTRRRIWELGWGWPDGEKHSSTTYQISTKLDEISTPGDEGGRGDQRGRGE